MSLALASVAALVHLTPEARLHRLAARRLNRRLRYVLVVAFTAYVRLGYLRMLVRG